MIAKDKILIYAAVNSMRGFYAQEAARAAGCTSQHVYKVLKMLPSLTSSEEFYTHRRRQLPRRRFQVVSAAVYDRVMSEAAAAIECSQEDAQSWAEAHLS